MICGLNCGNTTTANTTTNQSLKNDNEIQLCCWACKTNQTEQDITTNHKCQVII